MYSVPKSNKHFENWRVWDIIQEQKPLDRALLKNSHETIFIINSESLSFFDLVMFVL